MLISFVFITTIVGIHHTEAQRKKKKKKGKSELVIPKPKPKTKTIASLTKKSKKIRYLEGTTLFDEKCGLSIMHIAYRKSTL